MLNKDSICSFTWGFNHEFFLEGKNGEGNYVWSDPDYNGDNSIKKTEMTYKQWCNHIGVPFGRDKGTHKVGEYCGENVHYCNSPYPE